MDGGVLWQGGTNVFQLRRLLILWKRDTTTLPRRDTLLSGSVVEMATLAKRTTKFSLLRWSGVEFVLRGFADCLLAHTVLFCLIGAGTPIASMIG
jgi:hypothetical protein